MQWKNELRGGYRVENIRPTGDTLRPWQGEVTLGEDDVQTWTWTAEGQYYARMPSEYDLVGMTPITRENLDLGKITHTGWTFNRRDTKLMDPRPEHQCDVQPGMYFDASGKFLGPDENGLEPTFAQAEEHEVGVASARWGQCRCGKKAETEVQVGWDPKANAGAGGGQYEQVCQECRDADEARARELHWREVDMDEIGDLMFQIVQTRQPIEVRLRDYSDDPWSQEQLVGFRLDHDGENRVVYFVDANGRGWLYCQVLRASL